MTEFDRRKEEDLREQGPKKHSTFQHVFYDETYKINKLPLLRRLKLIFNMYYTWWLFASFGNFILIILYVVGRSTATTIYELASFAVGNLLIAIIVSLSIPAHAFL